VGKSTLFNRLTAHQGRSPGGRAIVNATAGTTRDLKDGKCYFGPMMVTDTGGLEEVGGGGGKGGKARPSGGDDVQAHIQQLINEKVEASVKGGDVVLFVLDARTGFTADDMYFGRWLQKLVS